MELQLGLLADAAYVDASGKLFILGEFRYINAKTIPTTHHAMTLVLRVVAPQVEVPTGKARLRLQFVDADGHGLIQNPPEAEIGFGPIGPAERGQVNAQIVIQLGNLPLPKYGDYIIHVWVNQQRLGEVKFHVNKLQAPSQS